MRERGYALVRADLRERAGLARALQEARLEPEVKARRAQPARGE